MSLGIETSLEQRADSSVRSGGERESITSAQVRRVGGECKLKASVSEKYILKNLLLTFSVLKNLLGKEILFLIIETRFYCKLEKIQ